jgi:hypothetical protein
MKAYGQKPQHPKGYPDLGLPRLFRPWWEAEGAQPEKHVGRREGREQIQRALTEDPRDGSQ